MCIRDRHNPHLCNGYSCAGSVDTGGETAACIGHFSSVLYRGGVPVCCGNGLVCACLLYTSCWALAGIPFVLFHENTTWRYLGMAICIIIGISSAVLGMFVEQEQYKILKKEPLLFDYEYLKELSNIYAFRKKKHKMIAVPCTILFIVGIITVSYTHLLYRASSY